MIKLKKLKKKFSRKVNKAEHFKYRYEAAMNLLEPTEKERSTLRYNIHRRISSKYNESIRSTLIIKELIEQEVDANVETSILALKVLKDVA